jgi:predicted aspartyl protease
MGIFSSRITISTLDGQQTREVEAMVDTGSTYTVLPSVMLREMGIAPTRKAKFEFGDGRVVEMDMGEARASINGETAVTPVVFGDDAPPLLGAVTLEELLLAVDPVGLRLVPARGLPQRMGNEPRMRSSHATDADIR